MQSSNTSNFRLLIALWLCILLTYWNKSLFFKGKGKNLKGIVKSIISLLQTIVSYKNEINICSGFPFIKCVLMSKMWAIPFVQLWLIGNLLFSCREFLFNHSILESLDSNFWLSPLTVRAVWQSVVWCYYAA